MNNEEKNRDIRDTGAAAGAPAAAEVRVMPVHGHRAIGQFIDVAHTVFADDSQWIAPLWLERRLHLSRFNPFLEHGEWQGWIAFHNDRPVGRVSAQIDRLHRQRYGSDTGHFGFLDAIDDPRVFAALIDSAEQWLRHRDVRVVTGPFNFSVNQECGLLVEGFETPPAMMMPHGRPWYDRHLRAQGYLPAIDMFAYWVNVDFQAPRSMQRLLERYGQRISVRPLDRRNLTTETRLLQDIFNDAWAENWGFVPFTEAEFDELTTSLRLLVPDELVQIAELDNEPVAFIAALPNLMEAIRDLNGSLFPIGWMKLLGRLKGKRVKTGRVPLMGVRKHFQNSPLGIALAFLVIDAVRQELYQRGIMEVEMSWILENNKGMRSILDSIGSHICKRYRLYSKML